MQRRGLRVRCAAHRGLDAALPYGLTAFAEVSQLAHQYDERKRGSSLACMREIDQILKAGCQGEPSCGDVAQAWATRCNDVAGSPLVLRILETRLAQANGGSGRVRLDKRGCKELSVEVLAAGNCSQKFQCEDALASIDTYRKRCLVAGALPSLQAGLAELSMRVGAGQSPKPIAVGDDASAFEPERFATPLADGSGIVALACAARAADLTGYLALRRDCDAGEIVVLRRQAGRGRGGSTLRVGRFPYETEAAFASTYPALSVSGEVGARASAGIVRLVATLTPVAARAGSGAYDAEASGALVKALVAERFAVRHSSEFAALEQLDVELVPLFKLLGREKVVAAKGRLKPLELAGFLRRSLRRPLADVGVDGSVSVGALNDAAGLAFKDALPKAVSAYQSELLGFAERVQKKTLSTAQQAALEQELAQALTACATAQAKQLENQGDLLECGFGGLCEADLLSELRSELASAQLAHASAHLRALLASESLDTPSAPFSEGARCLEP